MEKLQEIHDDVDCIESGRVGFVVHVSQRDWNIIVTQHNTLLSLCTELLPVLGACARNPDGAPGVNWRKYSANIRAALAKAT
jgi:hypothetical protein